MSLWRRLQTLTRSDGVRGFLNEDFHKAALTGQRQYSTVVPSEELKHVYLSSQGQSWPETMGKAELLPTEQGKQSRISTLPKKSGPGTMSRSLVKKVMGLSDVKEDVYGALNEWAAFELEFPVAATRLALNRLRKLEQWHRVIQVTKWMFSKGIGKTHGSYILLLKAYCMDGRLEEAEELWNALLVSHNRSMPKLLFAFMSNVYRRREMPDKVIQVFEQMESLGIKPDKDILKRAGEAYQQLNMQDKVEQLGKKYAIDSRTRRKEKRLNERKAREASKHEQLANDEVESCSLQYRTDEDEEDAQQQSVKAHNREERASFATEHLVNNKDESCSLQYKTDEDEEDVQQQSAKARNRDERASFGTEENPGDMKISKKGKKPTQKENSTRMNKSKRGKKLDSPSTSTATDEEFVKQIIDTM